MGASELAKKGDNLVSYEINQSFDNLSKAKLNFYQDQMPPVVEPTGKSVSQVLAREYRLNGGGLKMPRDTSEGVCKEAELSLQHYAELYELAPIGYKVLDQKGVVRDVNTTAAILFGTERKFLLGKPFLFWVENESKEIYKQLYRQVSETGQRKACKLKLLKKNGANFHALLECRVLSDINGNLANYLLAFSDISEQVAAETKFQETNTALRVLLKQREGDKSEMERNILTNIKKLVMPYLERFKQTQLREDQAQCLQIIQTNIENIISPFLKTLSVHYDDLTPREIEIANLVRDGHTTKEIASLLCVSSRSVEFHKDNIRKKMGLTNKKVNLRAYLTSLEDR